MCCLEGITFREEQLEQKSYSYQGIKTALVALAGNLKLCQGISAVLAGELF